MKTSNIAFTIQFLFLAFLPAEVGRKAHMWTAGGTANGFCGMPVAMWKNSTIRTATCPAPPGGFFARPAGGTAMRIHRKIQATILYVTHDQEETLVMSGYARLDGAPFICI